MKQEIKQIIPTPGKWYAMFHVEGSVKDPYRYLPVACWVLTENKEFGVYVDALVSHPVETGLILVMELAFDEGWEFIQYDDEDRKKEEELVDELKRKRGI